MAKRGLILTIGITFWVPTVIAAEFNYYPEVRKLILEAETAAAGIKLLPDKSNPHSWAAQLLARAGYLEDASLILSRSGGSESQLAPAEAIYGDFDRALKTELAIDDPGKRTSGLTQLAGVLWRMGDKANAMTALEMAKASAVRISDPGHRQLQLQIVEQQREAIPDDPPYILSATPRPPVRKASTSAAPAFTVTVNGFRPKSAAAVRAAAQQDEAFLTKLYALIAARDVDGLTKHQAEAPSSFQKMLGLASIEHLLIQMGQVKDIRQVALAGQVALKIPDDGADCSLAKAEALSSAAVAWGQMGDLAQASTFFDLALKNAESVSSELMYGKAVVVASIGAEQEKFGMAGASAASFKRALELASAIRVRPKPVNGVYAKSSFGEHFQDDCYREIFGAAIRAHDLGTARRSVELWRASGGGNKSVGYSIVDSWVAVGMNNEAVDFARGLTDPIERVPVLLWLARSLHDAAGAPAI